MQLQLHFVVNIGVAQPQADTEKKTSGEAQAAPEARATASACWLAADRTCTPSGSDGQTPLTAVHTAVMHETTSGPTETE